MHPRDQIELRLEEIRRRLEEQQGDLFTTLSDTKKQEHVEITFLAELFCEIYYELDCKQSNHKNLWCKRCEERASKPISV